MARFNTKPKPTHGGSPVRTELQPSGTSYYGAPGFAHDASSELFLLAVQNFVGKDTFYEKASNRDDRFIKLIYKVVEQDLDWLRRFLPWLRNEANMRTASLIGAVEAARAMTDRKIPGGRQLIDAVIQRADEPGEVLGYFMQTYGRKIPKPIKRGVADAATRLFNEYNLLKYDTASHAFRFGDVLELCHPDAKAPWQSQLFKFALDRRHSRDEFDVSKLPMVQAQAALRVDALKNSNALLDGDRLKGAGFTWEDALSLGGSKLDKKLLWEAMIPNMGYMALLRNLRNFDEAGVSDKVAEQVAARLSDPDKVAKSRQFPFRFLSAYRNVSSLRWAYPLEKALNASLSNVPAFPGRTLILVDQSPSMFPGYHFSTKNSSDISLADQAKIFGSALAVRAESATLVQYGGTSQQVAFKKSESILKLLDRFDMIDSTDTGAAVRKWFNEHDRVIVITDEQTSGYSAYRDVFSPIPAQTLCVTFNLAGYQYSHAAGGATRLTIGGLSDAAFKLLPALEARHHGQWPF